MTAKPDDLMFVIGALFFGAQKEKYQCTRKGSFDFGDY